MVLGKGGFIADIFLLAVGSTWGRIILGLIVVGFIGLVVAGKIAEAQDKKRAPEIINPPSTDGASGTISLDK